MTITYHGNFVYIATVVGDVSGTPITLKDGYSIDTIVITYNHGITGLGYSMPIPSGAGITIKFPPINSHSPSVIAPIFSSNTNNAICFSITKFGQIPDPHYFDTNFEPILVTDDDGNKYPVIPSDQFK